MGGLGSNGSVDGILPQLIGQCPVVEVSFGGAKTPCLLDTGSMVSMITESFFLVQFPYTY